MDQRSSDSGPFTSWKSSLVYDLERVALRNRWGLALMVVGWSHLGFFLVCQTMFSAGNRTSSHYLALWAAEFAANLWIIRRIAGPGWARSTPLGGVLVRVWATFLILSFNVASLNTLTGWTLDWFKPIWATLSTFGFATTAYLVNPWFFVPAVQMYFTGLTMVYFPSYSYLIYGVSWCAALQGVGLILERKRARRESEAEPRDAEAPEATSAAA